MNYGRNIIHVLAECQSDVLRPVKEEKIKQMIISEYHDGDESGFCDKEFWAALLRGVRSGRFLKVRDSYLLSNKKNEAYDPREHEKWLDGEGFDGKQREAMWIDYDVEFGLYDD